VVILTGFVMCSCVCVGFVCVLVYVCGFCNVWLCVCVSFVMCGWVCVGFVMCVCVCVGVLQLFGYFDNMCPCIYCLILFVLCFCIVSFMYIQSYLLCLY
jgi:hypothetical protein